MPEKGRICKNPECNKVVPDHKRKNNKSGRQEYCSLKCYSVASPGMLAVFNKFAEGETFSRKDFKDLLVRLSLNYTSCISMATSLKISRSTLTNWLNKFEIKGLSLRPYKVRREKYVLKYRDVMVGDVLTRIADPRHRMLKVVEKPEDGVLIQAGTRSVLLIPRVLKLWKKVKV